MTTIDKLRDLDLQIHAVFEDAFPTISELLKKMPALKTGTTILFFIIKTNFIKEGILDLYKTENYYSIQILFRSLIEHLMRVQYVFTRHRLHKTDSVVDDYT